MDQKKKIRILPSKKAPQTPDGEDIPMKEKAPHAKKEVSSAKKVNQSNSDVEEEAYSDEESTGSSDVYTSDYSDEYTNSDDSDTLDDSNDSDTTSDETPKKKVPVRTPINMNNPLMKSLRPMFDRIDTNRDGHIQPSEIAHVFRAFGKNAPEKEIRKMIQVVDTDGDGQLDFNEFVDLMRDSMPEIFERAENPSTWKNYILNEAKNTFKVFDQNDDGVISKEEMRFVLTKLAGNEVNDTDVNIIINHIDKNNSGDIDFDEFQDALNAKDGMVFQLLEKMVMPSPLDYLQAFLLMPDSFRPSLLHQMIKEGTLRATKFMKPYLNESGLGYQDLTLDVSKPDKITLLPCYLESCGTFKISIRSANGIPSPNIKSKQFIANKHITKYKAYICLVDLATNEFLSNVYTIRATANPNREDGWLFPKKDPINDVYLRSFYDIPDLALYIELVVEIYSKKEKEKKKMVNEQCAGWTTIPISKNYYKNVQTQRLNPIPFPVKGGTLKNVSAINVSDIRNRRKDFAGILRNVLFVGKPNPTINVKISKMIKPKQVEYFSRCPPNLIFNYRSVKLLELYRTTLAKHLLHHPTLDDQHHVVNSLLLSQVPKLMDAESEIWMNFVNSWLSMKSTIQNREKKFLEHIRNFYPVIHCHSIPPEYTHAQTLESDKRQRVPENTTNLEKQFEVRLNYISQFGVASKKMTCQSDYYYEPFDINEVLYDVL